MAVLGMVGALRPGWKADLILVEGEPVGGHPLIFLGAVALASLPAVAFFANWSQRGLALSGVRRAREHRERR